MREGPFYQVNLKIHEKNGIHTYGDLVNQSAGGACAREV